MEYIPAGLVDPAFVPYDHNCHPVQWMGKIRLLCPTPIIQPEYYYPSPWGFGYGFRSRPTRHHGSRWGRWGGGGRRRHGGGGRRAARGLGATAQDMACTATGGQLNEAGTCIYPGGGPSLSGKSLCDAVNLQWSDELGRCLTPEEAAAKATEEQKSKTGVLVVAGVALAAALILMK